MTAPLAFRRILVPVDFSRSSARALEVAQGLVTAARGRLVLLYVSRVETYLPDDAIWLPSPKGLVAARYAEVDVHAELERLAETLRADGLEVDTIVQAGPPGDVIAHAATPARVDLVVMGTHGRTGLAHLLLGSVAEQVVREAQVPVLTIRTPSDRGGRGTPDLRRSSPSGPLAP
jgi:nucleotide-binding universal stress UspA family protein